MTTEAGSTTVLLVGALLVRMALTRDYLRYVRAGMGPWLIAAGVLLILLALAGLVASMRAGSDGHDDGHGHDHVHGQRIGWLLLAPVLALLLVTPPALGSYGVDRTTPLGVTVGSGSAVFAPLPAGGDPREMTLLEFDQRSVDRAGASLTDVPVRLTGFVARPQDGSGARLARYQIACCAADAVAAVVRVVGLEGTPVRDSWLTVVGTFTGTGADGVPELAVTGSRRIPAPVDPYEA
jgi:uncharacterized repeat protein (TIGR03943 family)